jgi:hypothetical protein
MPSELRPMTVLSKVELERIQETETAAIMTKIKEPRVRPVFFTKKRILWTAMSLLLILAAAVTMALLAPKPEFTMADFYQNLTEIRDRMDEILETNLEELSKTSFSTVTPFDNPLLRTHRRDDVLAIYEQSKYDLVEGDYLENLETTRMWMDEIVAVIDAHDEIVLGEAYSPDPSNPELRYRFTMSEASFLVVDKRDGHAFSYIKMGLDEDMLKYDEIHYIYDLEGESLSIAQSLLYNYFRFSENNEAVYINSDADESSLRYTSIQTGRQFTVARGTTILESEVDPDAVGYFLDAYDPVHHALISMTVKDGVILRESYRVFSPYVLLYDYTDPNLFDDAYEFTFNIIPATGWDYAVVTEGGTNEELLAARGIYRDDGTRLYDGHLYNTVTPTYAYLGLKAEKEGSIGEATFDVSEYGLTMVDPRFTFEDFEAIRIDSFDDMKQAFLLDGLDFFREDLRGELYRYLDEDIRRSIEGDDLDYETTGDVDKYLEALGQFNERFQIQGSMTDTAVTTISFYQNAALVSSVQSRTETWLDLEATYYRSRSMLPASPDSVTEQYLMMVDEKLVRLDIDHHIIRPDVLLTKADREDFLQYLPIRSDGNPLRGMVKIDASPGQRFDIDLNLDYFHSDVDMDVVFEQLGLTGLSDAKLTLNLVFDADHLGYESTLTIQRLKADPYDVVYQIVSRTEIEPVEAFQPLESTQYGMFLPEAISDILIDTPIDQSNRYYVGERPAYVRLNLEPGVYQWYVNASSESVSTMLDASGAEIPHTEYLEVEEAGIYYVMIDASYEQSVDVVVYTVILPTEREIELGPAGGTFAADDLAADVIYRFHFPDFETPMILIVRNFTPNGNDAHLELKMENRWLDYEYGWNHCAFDDPFDDCYFQVQAHDVEPMIFSGSYEGSVSFLYEFVSPDSFETEVTVGDLAECGFLLLSEETPELTIHFTVTTALHTRATFRAIGMYKSYIGARLYDSDGTLITEGFAIWNITLSPGNYTMVLFYESDPVPYGLIKPYFPN